MAYGKIKCDTLTWDDSSTDTNVVVSTIAQKASPTFTGTVTIPTAAITTGNITTANITTGVFTGDVTLTGASYNVVFDASDNALEFADNAKATFGTGSDLSIYHNGTNNYIDTVLSTADFYVRPAKDFYIQDKATGEVSFKSVKDGTTELYHNGVKKIETTAAGCDITGTAVTDGLTVAGTSTYDGTSTQTAETLSAASTITIDCSTGNYFTLTAGQNTTFAFSNVPASGNAYVLMLQVAVVTYSLTWPAAVKWSSTTGGAAPTLTANKVNNFVLVTSDGGTTWRGSANTDYAS